MHSYKKTLLSLALVSALNLTACGGGTTDPVADTNTATDVTDVTVERGPVLYAHVIDNKGVKGEPIKDANGHPTNQYRFALSPEYPITSTGGYIDLNGDGVLSEGDVAMGNLTLKAYAGTKATLASSLAADAENLTVLEGLGFTYEQLTTATPSTDLAIAGLSDAVFKYLIENNVTDMSTLDLSSNTALVSDIEARLESYDGTATALELEQNLMTELAASVESLDQAEVDSLLSSDSAISITQSSFDSMEMTPEYQQLVAFSWDEEKMAKDLYLNLYNELLTQGIDIKPLYNVATNSETQHQEAMRALAETNDLDLIGFANSDGSAVVTGYDGEALAAFASGAFILPEVQTMYDDLWAHAGGDAISVIPALEAACMVEVVDVNDLNASIDEALALGAMDLVAAFESLRSGSYNHYWAFDNALIKQGVAEGCGSLGVDYDKDYPKVPKGNGNQ